MDVKVTRNLAVYQSAVAAGRGVEKSAALPAPADSRVRGDEILISGDALKRKEAAKMSSQVHRSMEDGASPERIAQLKQQIGDGSYQVSAELIARRLMSGI